LAFVQKHHNSLSSGRQNGAQQMICSGCWLMGTDSCHGDIRLKGSITVSLSFLSSVTWLLFD